ncbi:MBL fold metallo-hydrolase [Granulicoccus sp. GXG6511]|uniref:MBL fold metallo-hydrolase n=1 Tax=Granulicoccus sp. GXG6511 TaxID=3381351 RepID=UPI003D7D0FEA
MLTPTRLLAPNHGSMTLQGTNTWVVTPGDEKAIVIDPGPLDLAHRDAIEQACPLGIAEVWVTHRHDDHIASAPDLGHDFGAPVRTFDPNLSTGRPLQVGETRAIGDGELEILHLPGHTSDSVGFLFNRPEHTDLLTGDMILGEGTTVIMYPDGNLTDYLESLRRLADLVAERNVRQLLPGHGPVVDDPEAWIAFYGDHRAERLQQVRAALAEGANTPDEVVTWVYGDLSPVLRRAAMASTLAQLDYLKATPGEGQISAPGAPRVPDQE